MVDIGRWLGAGWAAFQRNAAAFVIASLVAIVLSVVTCSILGTVMSAGLSLMALKALRGEKTEVGDLFKPFDKFAPLIILWLIFIVISIVLGVLKSVPILGQLIGLVISPILGLLTSFAIYQVVDKGTEPIPALTASWEVMQKNLVMFWVAGLVIGIISFVGIVGVCVGIFVTIPVAIIATGAGYLDNFGVAGVPQVPPTTPTPTPPAPMAPPEEPPII